MNDPLTPLILRDLGCCDYETVWRQMQQMTDTRTADAPDEVWVVEHPPVLTLGQAGSRAHLLADTDIPLIHCDRGGQITYHGPGQLVVYVLLNLPRKGLGVRALVRGLEDTIIALLNDLGIQAHNRCDAPGVYVDGAKICSLGLRVRRGCSFHGLALNVDMDLSPFQLINPCGLQNQAMTQLRDLGVSLTLAQVAARWYPHFLTKFRYTLDNFTESE
jgi:lipoyl(octanoyl) transferase